jgi:peptidoglycan/LPS O-acetylase OafA/YrhL
MWSLSVEEMFYLVFPIVCLLLRRPVMLLVAIVPLVILAPFNRVWLEGIEPWDESSYLSCVDGLALGCLVGWLSERWPLSQSRGRLAMTAGMAAVLLVIVFREMTRVLGLVDAGVNITVLEMGMALILLAMGSGVGSAVFARGTSLLQAIGRCSYEIYLTHMFVVFGGFGMLRAIFGAEAPQVVYRVGYAVMLVLSVLLGHAVSRWFSEPANRSLRAWFAARVSAAERAALKVST